MIKFDPVVGRIVENLWARMASDDVERASRIGALAVGVLGGGGRGAPRPHRPHSCASCRATAPTLFRRPRVTASSAICAQYPSSRLATPRQRARARPCSSGWSTAAERGTGGTCARRGARGTTRAPGRAGAATAASSSSTRNGTRSRAEGSIFDFARPKALIYANAPGRPLVLVGAMWSTRDGEVGPTPAGPIMRWHSHVVCKEGSKRGLKPLAGGKCPPGARLQQGASEMLHVWFTGDLRSAFAITAPRARAVRPGLLPRDRLPLATRQLPR